MVNIEFVSRWHGSGGFRKALFSSGNDIGRHFILKPPNAISQRQFLALEPRDLELIGNGLQRQRRNRVVQIAMLHAQRFELPLIAFVIHRHEPFIGQLTKARHPVPERADVIKSSQNTLCLARWQDFGRIL